MVVSIVVAARSLVDYKDRRAQHRNRTLIVPRRQSADAVSPFARAHAAVWTGRPALTGRREWYKVAIRCVVGARPGRGDTAMPNTVRLHRVLATKPDKVYRAFIEADAMAKWLPPNGFTCTVHHLNAKVGGTFRMSFRNFTTGMSHSFGGEYLELVPGERALHGQIRRS